MPQEKSKGFDVRAAKAAGHTDQKIRDYLAQTRPSFDIDGAMKAGWSLEKIGDYIGQQANPQQKVPQPEAKEIGLGNALLQGVANFPSSLGKSVETMVSPVTQPVEFLKGLFSFHEASQPFSPEGGVIRSQIGKAVTDRYGGWNEIKNTIANDPAGALLDVSAILSGGGAGLTKLGTASRIGKLSKIGSAVTRAGQTVDPLMLPIKAAEATLKTGGKLGKVGLGITTGTSEQTIAKATEGGKSFRSAMRGATTGEDVLATAKGALSTISEERRSDYVNRLQSIKQSNAQIPIANVKTKLNDLLQSYGVKRTQDGLDLSRSALDASEGGKLESIVKMVDDWGSQPQDLTPAGMDILKKKLDDFYSPSKNSRAIVSSLRNIVKENIVAAIPEYRTMTANYEKSMELEKAINQATGIGGSPESAIKKLTGALKQDNEFRQRMVTILQDAAGEDLLGQIAGLSMNAVAPRGMIGRGMDVALVYGAISRADPRLFALLAVTSPRVVGEFVNALGPIIRSTAKAGSAVQDAIRAVPTTRAYQTGRISSIPELTGDKR